MTKSSLLAAAFACALLMLLGCHGTATISEGHTLFDIGYGKSDSSLDVTASARNDISVTMNKGIFHILSRSESKILRVSSYGQTLAMWYDPLKGSAPLVLKSVNMDELSSAKELGRFAIQVQFTDPALLAVDSRQMLYVEDAGVIRRFDSSGAELSSLGKEGLGGAPFSGAIELTVLEDDDLAVSCVSDTGLQVYFYDRAGSFLNKLALEDTSLPTPESLARQYPSIPGARIIASMESTRASMVAGKRALFLKVNYYYEKSDPQSGVALTIDPIGSWIISIDASNGEIGDSFALQSTVNSSGIDQQLIAAKSYVLVCVKWSSDGLGGEMYCYTPKGKMVGKRSFMAPDKSAELLAYAVGDDRQLYILSQLPSTLRMYSWALPVR